MATPKLPLPDVGTSLEVKLYRAGNPVRTVTRRVLRHTRPGKKLAPVVELAGRQLHLCRVYVAGGVPHWGAFFELHHQLPEA